MRILHQRAPSSTPTLTLLAPQPLPQWVIGGAPSPYGTCVPVKAYTTVPGFSPSTPVYRSVCVPEGAFAAACGQEVDVVVASPTSSMSPSAAPTHARRRLAPTRLPRSLAGGAGPFSCATDNNADAFALGDGTYYNIPDTGVYSCVSASTASCR